MMRKIGFAQIRKSIFLNHTNSDIKIAGVYLKNKISNRVY